jgi:hypothetical protein
MINVMHELTMWLHNHNINPEDVVVELSCRTEEDLFRVNYALEREWQDRMLTTERCPIRTRHYGYRTTILNVKLDLTTWKSSQKRGEGT